MRKRTIQPDSTQQPTPASAWLDLEPIAEVEISSEDPSHPIEGALRHGAGPGWRAATAGEQTIRLRFDAPQPIRRVRLVFHEGERPRTQEFVLRWSGDGGQSYREIVRQQYNFSPPGSTDEVEEYTVELDQVSVLELRIIPAIGGGEARASLERLALG
jgi:hypothetical protein